jgi:hypothetical protein
MATPDHSTTNPIIEWLSAQWFFILALVTGGIHAGTFQAKSIEHSKKLEALETVSDRLARIETHLEHLLEKVSSRH